MPPTKLTCDRSGMMRFASQPARCSTFTGWAVPVAAAAIALSVRFSATPCALAALPRIASRERTRVSVLRAPANFRFIRISPRVKNSRPERPASCSARWCRFHFAPDEINWNAEQYDHEPRQRLGASLIRDQQDHCDCRRENDVQSRQNWVGDNLIGTLGVRTGSAQPEQPDPRQRVEDQRRENDVVEQLTIGP